MSGFEFSAYCGLAFSIPALLLGAMAFYKARVKKRFARKYRVQGFYGVHDYISNPNRRWDDK
jgi:hypothetical protein